MITCNNVGDKTIKEEKEKKTKNEEIRKEGMGGDTGKEKKASEVSDIWQE